MKIIFKDRKTIFKNRKHPIAYLYCIANYYKTSRYQESMEYFDIRDVEILVIRNKR